jgi:Flp pilus assembly protein TadD
VKTGALTLALAFALGPALAAPPSPLWDDVAHPNRPKCRELAAEADRIARGRNVNQERAAIQQLLATGAKLCAKDVELLTLLGDLQVRLGDFPAARATLERARALAPAGEDRDALLALDLGLSRTMTGDLESGLVEYRRAEAIGGLRDPWKIPYDMGDNLMALGRLDEAIEAYRRAARLAPHEAIVRFALGVALDRDGQAERSRGEISTALTYDNRLSSLTSDMFMFIPPADRHYYLALAYCARRQHGEAAVELATYLAAVPNGPYAPRAREVQQRCVAPR